MINELAQAAVPQTVFFLGFFFAFSLLEILFIVLIDKLVRRHWVFVVDVLLSFRVHHRAVFRVMAALALFALLTALVLMTPLVSVIAGAPVEIQVFAGALLLVMGLVYAFVAHTLPKPPFERHAIKYTYLMISLLLFAGVMNATTAHYARYKKAVNTVITDPAMGRLEAIQDKAKTERWIVEAAQKITAGECAEIDFRALRDGVNRQFVRIGSSADLARPKKAPADAAEKALVGRLCETAEAALLLNEEGDWYWVVSEQ